MTKLTRDQERQLKKRWDKIKFDSSSEYAEWWIDQINSLLDNNLKENTQERPIMKCARCDARYPQFTEHTCERPKEIRSMGYNDHLDRVLDGTYQDQFNEIIETLNNLTKHIYK